MDDKQREPTEKVRQRKNVRAAETDKRARAVLRSIGLSKADFNPRKPKAPKPPTNVRWWPEDRMNEEGSGPA